jgi:undecaprenyl-diphosphatase
MLKFIALGVLQGITEFLPVSSSGHLVIAQRLLGLAGEEVALSVVLHLGTCLALVVFFYRDLLAALRSIKLLSFIAIATIITGIIGVAGKHFFEGLFSSPRLAALALLVTGAILILTRRYMLGQRQDLNAADAAALGLAQAIAIVPGISRSGITISTLLFRGLERQRSFRFSFLVSIPAIFGAAILESRDIGCVVKLDFANFLAGFIFSFLAGLLSLRLLKLVMRRAKLHYFGYYCIAAAIIAFLFIK